MEVEEVGSALFQRFPERNPVEATLPEIRNLIRRLPGYRPGSRIGRKLVEAVLRAWTEEYEEGE